MKGCPVSIESDRFLRECEEDEAMSEWVEDRAHELMEEMLDDPEWVEKADDWCEFSEAESVLANLAYIGSHRLWTALGPDDPETSEAIHNAYNAGWGCLERRKERLLGFARQQAEKDWHYKQAEERELRKRGYADDY